MEAKTGTGSIKVEFASTDDFDHIKARLERVNDPVPYCTTIHLLASALSKLGRIQSVQRLFRGISKDKGLPDQ